MQKKEKGNTSDERKTSVTVVLSGYTYSTEEAWAARDNGQLLCLRLDTNYSCNLQCRYCYSTDDQSGMAPTMPIELAKRVVDEAKALGARSIIYLGGGEPLLYEYFWGLVEYMTRCEIIPVVFTNGTLVTPEIATRLSDVGASVVVKYDGPREIQDRLTGKGSYDRIHRGYDYLYDALSARQSNGITRLGAAPCVCKTNRNVIGDLWRSWRRAGVYPNIERATCVGAADSDLVLSREDTCTLYEELRKIDEKEFGLPWKVPFSAIPAHSCFVSLAGCHVKADGSVCLCPELPPVATLKEKSLSEALSSPGIAESRLIEHMIREPCRSCRYFRHCVGGCRSKAHQYWHDNNGPDPFCPFCRNDNAGGLQEGEIECVGERLLR